MGVPSEKARNAKDRIVNACQRLITEEGGDGLISDLGGEDLLELDCTLQLLARNVAAEKVRRNL